MRLIDTTILELHSFFNRDIPHYAILSHCWGDDEVSLQDFNTGARNKAGFEKIANVCRLAKREYDLDWVWVDTCCIDKTSSAELSESINSMYRWYQRSAICYAFLTDVNIENANWTQAFALCRWFKRGWTLQELLAPSEVRFFDKDLQFIGTKDDLAEIISAITRIPKHLLQGSWDEHRTSTSVACRMSWASHRETTREEDTAYCLLGIFDIHMPLLYGEGQKAFLRLQEYIVGSSTDESIFAWMSNGPSSGGNSLGGLLASSPKDFAHSNNIVPIKWTARRPTSVTNNRIQVYYAVPDLLDLARHCGRWLMSDSATSRIIYLNLNCTHQIDGQPPQWITVLLECRGPGDGVYHRQDTTSLLQRQVNLSLRPRFYAKIYVSHPRDHRPQEAAAFYSPLDQHRQDWWIRWLQTAHHLRSQLDWAVILLCPFLIYTCSPELTDAWHLTPVVYCLLAAVGAVVIADVAFEAFHGGHRGWRQGLVCLTAILSVLAPLRLQMACVYPLIWTVVDIVVPYRPLRPGGTDDTALRARETPMRLLFDVLFASSPDM